MPNALFLSPHLDDVAFSCGAAFATLAACGWDAHLVTLFTRSVPDPRGFALACQTDKGIPPEVDYMALRRAEDERAARALGAASVRWLPHPEAPHRGYHSAPALFAGVHEGDRDAWRPVADDVAALVAELDPELVFAPQAIGGHVDHRHVVRAVSEVMRAREAHAGRALSVAWYRDTPYIIRDPAARTPEPAADPDAPLRLVVLPADDRALAAKLDACAAYASQLGFQFGGEPAMRAALTQLAADEAARAGAPGHAELVGVQWHHRRVAAAFPGARVRDPHRYGRVGHRFHLRRLGPDDAPAYRALRLEMFARHPAEFRYTPADEGAVPLAATAERLATSYVVGAFDGAAHDAALVGLAGLTRQTGEKLRHTALLWGMYVADVARGTGLGDRLVADVLEEARAERVSRVVLTVMADNARAERLYARWGFARYGVDPGAVMIDGAPRDEALMVRHLAPGAGA